MDSAIHIDLQTEVFPASVENVIQLWPRWEPLLRRALKGIETHQPIDIRRAVLGEQAHLWVQWTGRLEAFVVTEFVDYPQGRWLRLWLAATADGVEFAQDKFLEVLSAWRDANDCRGFELIGRMGWLRRFPDARFVGVIMRTSV